MKTFKIIMYKMKLSEKITQHKSYTSDFDAFVDFVKHFESKRETSADDIEVVINGRSMALSNNQTCNLFISSLGTLSILTKAIGGKVKVKKSRPIKNMAVQEALIALGVCNSTFGK